MAADYAASEERTEPVCLGRAPPIFGMFVGTVVPFRGEGSLDGVELTGLEFVCGAGGGPELCGMMLLTAAAGWLPRLPFVAGGLGAGGGAGGA